MSVSWRWARVSASSAPNGSSMQQHLRLHRERARDPDPLSHAARELVRALPRGVCPCGPGADCARPLVALGRGLRAAEHLVDREPHIAVGREPGQQRVFWNTTARSGPGSFTSLPSRITTPRRGAQQARDDVQQRGFSAAGMADDRDYLALVDVQVHVAHGTVHRGARVEIHPHGFQREIGRRHLDLVRPPT